MTNDPAMMPSSIANAVCMNPQPTPEQQHDFENALKIGEVLASSVETVDSPRIRVNPHTLKEAVGIYNTLGAKKPFLQRSEQFVMNCLLYSAETFAACSHRVVLCHYLTGRDVVYWYGNGIVKDREPLDNVRFFVGDNSFLIASILINSGIYLRLQPFLVPQYSAERESERQRRQLAALEAIPKYEGPPADPSRPLPRSTRCWPAFAVKRSETPLRASAESEPWKSFTSDIDHRLSVRLRLRILCLAAIFTMARQTAGSCSSF
jgi:hypothetical protein